MNDYDKAERAAIKRLDPPAFLAWLLVGLDADLVFKRWLETQSAPFPGEPDRRCDCVAEFISRSGSQPPWACLVEPQGQWQSNFLTRALQYLFLLHDELRHGPHEQDRYLMMAGIVDLCDRPLQRKVSWLPPGATGPGLTAEVWSRHVYTESASATLDGIAAGAIGRCLLPWVPLMAGGDEEATTQRWKELANAEPDATKRANYGALALVLAEKRDRKDLWAKALEGWNVQESPIMREWLREAEEKGMRSMLLHQLRSRFSEPLPADVVASVEAQTDAKELLRWGEVAMKSDTIQKFRDAIRPTNGAEANNPPAKDA